MKQTKNTLNKRFDIQKTFEYNRAHGPFEKIKDKSALIKKTLGKYGIDTDFFGYKTKLPIGVAAGPLYNKNYMTGAMNDGFTVITWKTFRGVDRLAHRNDGTFLGHNIVFLPSNKILNDQTAVKEIVGSLKAPEHAEEVVITNSFGMPSTNPLVWMPEITEIEKVGKKKNKLVITSVVGTPTEHGDIQTLANDYMFAARCAELAGAKIIELNLSCPNVHGKEGMIYKDSENARIIAKTTREGLKKETKLLLKVGFASTENYKEFIEKTGDYVDGIVAINTVPMRVIDEKGKQALPGGLLSGVCGKIIIDKSVEAVKNLISARKSFGKKYTHIKIVGCGGVTNAENFMRHIDAGAEFVMCATAALFNPELPMQIAEYIKKNKLIKKI